MARKLYSLTDEHRARLTPWAELWIANAMSTTPMTDADREICADAARRLYAAAGLKTPRIVFVPSPLVLRFAAGFAAAIWWQRANGHRPATDAATRAATRAATDAATRGATRAATDAATRAATYAATYDATYAATRAATYAATRAATRDATYAATYDATYDATRAATDAATRDATRAATDDATRAATGDDLSHWYVVNADMRQIAGDFGVGQFGLECVLAAWRMWQDGNQWSAWDSYLTFFRHVAHLPIDYSKYDAWETLALHSGPRIVHPEFCMISDRPTVLTVDNQHRPHGETGPFCRWSDGFALYSWHGTRIPAWIIERPAGITAEKIDAESNAEVRRVMISRYGSARYIQDSGAELVHSLPDNYYVRGLQGARLFRKSRPGDTDIVMVAVKNSTPEPDGSVKDYFLRVEPGAYAGLASRDCHAAVASTWRNADGSLAFQRPQDYAPRFES